MLKSIIGSFIGTCLAFAAIVLGPAIYQDITGYTPAQSVNYQSSSYSDYSYESVSPGAAIECHAPAKAAEMLKDRTFKISGSWTDLDGKAVAIVYLDDPTSRDHETFCLEVAGLNLPKTVRVVNGELEFAK